MAMSPVWLDKVPTTSENFSLSTTTWDWDDVRTPCLHATFEIPTKICHLQRARYKPPQPQTEEERKKMLHLYCSQPIRAKPPVMRGKLVDGSLLVHPYKRCAGGVDLKDKCSEEVRSAEECADFVEKVCSDVDANAMTFFPETGKCQGYGPLPKSTALLQLGTLEQNVKNNLEDKRTALPKKKFDLERMLTGEAAADVTNTDEDWFGNIIKKTSLLEREGFLVPNISTLTNATALAALITTTTTPDPKTMPCVGTGWLIHILVSDLYVRPVSCWMHSPCQHSVVFNKDRNS